MTLTLTEGHNCVWNNIISAIALKLGMTVDLCTVYMPTLVSMTLTLMQGNSGLTHMHKQWALNYFGKS